ncbi:hypothetical protein ACFWH4_00185, partial [Streptomyces sp. NPDC127091]
MTEHAQAQAPTEAVTAALHEVAALGGFFVLPVGGPDEGRHLLDRSGGGGGGAPGPRRAGGGRPGPPRRRAGGSPRP